MAIPKTKNIIISTPGPIRCLGGIEGPIRNPFQADISLITNLLSETKIVYEVSKTGKKVMLNRLNLNKENFDKDGNPTTNGSNKYIASIQENLAITSSKKGKFQPRSTSGTGSDFRRY